MSKFNQNDSQSKRRQACADSETDLTTGAGSLTGNSQSDSCQDKGGHAKRNRAGPYFFDEEPSRFMDVTMEILRDFSGLLMVAVDSGPQPEEDSADFEFED